MAMGSVIQEINRLQLGAALVVTKKGVLVGIVTDGDIRRHLMKNAHIHEDPVEDVMTASPKSLGPEILASHALTVMERNQITVLPIVNPVKKVLGILHLHDVLGKGAFKFNGC
jgi:arabinose-5-phosphate isomerase